MPAPKERDPVPIVQEAGEASGKETQYPMYRRLERLQVKRPSAQCTGGWRGFR
jgi:hypothetical protein